MVITPEQTWALEIKEMRANLQLLYFFTWRNFKIRYKQTFIGAFWAVLRPFILMVVFTVIFYRGAGITSGSDIPYPVFSYAGLLFWTYFSQTVTQVSSSLVTFQDMLKKIYFPRLLVPLSASLTGIIDFAFSTLIFIAITLYYGIAIQPLGVLLFLPLVLASILTVLGVGLFMAALNVRYRDVEQLMPFLVQVLLFVTPVIYPVSTVPANLQWLLYLNPMTGIIEVARYSLLGIGSLDPLGLLISGASCLFALIVGLLFFKSQERKLGDLI